VTSERLSRGAWQRRWPALPLLILALLFARTAPAAARVVARQPPSLRARAPGPPPATGWDVVADLDDDDDDGVADSRQTHDVPQRDLFAMRAGGPGEQGTLTTEGPIRIVADGRPQRQLELRGEVSFFVQGLAPSQTAGDASVHLRTANGDEAIARFTVVGLSFLRADGSPLDASHQALGVSHAITNDEGLPRGVGSAQAPDDVEAIRFRVEDVGVSDLAEIAVRSSAPGDAPRSNRPHLAVAPAGAHAWTSAWMRLVGDAVDEHAPGVGAQTLRVALRDQVEVVYRAASGTLRQGARVGRPGSEDGVRAVRRGHLRVRILRAIPGGRPAIGGDDQGALHLGREQVAIANEIWLQCFIDFGAPADADVAVVDPPPPYLLSVADGDGLPAAGGGEIRLRVDGRVVPVVTTRAGDPPIETALRVADALRRLGYAPRVLQNPRTEPGAAGSADVLVRRADHALATLSADGDAPLSSDARQRLQLGEVDLGDGLSEFDNMTAVAGTLEERTLVHAIQDDDPTTVEIVIVPSFARGTRQGESFIEADGGTILDALILDRNGVGEARAAWTQSHELGHVLLDEPYHPDNVGPDRPWLLMDADSSEPTVLGPKRITQDECLRVRNVSGLGAAIRLLRRPQDSR